MIKNALTKTVAVFILAACLVAPDLAFAAKLKPTLGPDGKPPKTTMVEMSHQILKELFASGKKRTIVLIGETPGIFNSSNPNFDAAVVDGMKRGDWENILAKPYMTARSYPVSPMNFISIAAKAGLVDKLYWVPPTKKSVGEEPMDGFKDYLRGQNISNGELATLKQTKKSIQGRLDGIPVVICRLDDLPKIKEEVVLITDVNFFIELYQDEIKTPFLDLFGWYTVSLGNSKLKVSEAYISYSTLNGPVPLEYRFMGGYINTYLTDFAKIKDGPPVAWEKRASSMYLSQFFQPEDVATAIDEAETMEPHDASLKFALAMACFTLKNLDCMREKLDMAVAMDRSYYPEYLEMSSYFISQKMNEDAEYFVNKAVKTAPEDPRVHTAMKELCLAAKDYTKAGETVQKLIDLGFKNPDNMKQLAETYMDRMAYNKAEEAYKEGLAMIPAVNRKDGAQLLAGLAKCYDAQNDIKEAIDTYKEAIIWVDDAHQKAEMTLRLQELEDKWAPFMTPGR